MPLPRQLQSFSLRTLMVLVAVLCAWLAWERHVVTSRRKVRRALEAGINGLDFSETTVLYANGQPLPRTTVPWFRRWLGDEAVQAIHYSVETADGALVLAKRWFPEAKLVESYID